MKKRLAAENDYTSAQLPHTRKEVFFDICQLYSGSLLRIGFILLLFALPLIVLRWIADENELVYLTIAQETVDIEQKLTIYQEFQVVDSFFSMFSIAGYMIFFVGLSGAARMIRQYAWEEPVNLKLDLLKGIRQNWKAYLFLGFLTGCWTSLSRYCIESILYMQGGWLMLNFLPVIIGVGVFLPILGFALISNAIYSNPFSQNIRISLFLYLKRPVTAAGIGTLFIVLPLLSGIAPTISLRLLVRIVFVLISPFLLFVWFLWCFKQLDLFINPKHHPELIRRGLTEEGSPRENGDVRKNSQRENS